MMIGRALKELDPLINADMLSAALGIEKRDAKNMLKDRYLWAYRDVEVAANLAGVNVERLVNYAENMVGRIGFKNVDVVQKNSFVVEGKEKMNKKELFDDIVKLSTEDFNELIEQLNERRERLLQFNKWETVCDAIDEYQSVTQQNIYIDKDGRRYCIEVHKDVPGIIYIT